MPNFFRSLFDSSFMPHGHCYRWEPEILWLHAFSDGSIALAYYTIPFLLVYIVRKRRDLAFPWIFVMFGAFIVLCGTTHVLEIWSIWNGAYRMTGAVKAVTGVVSLATAVALVPLVPKVLALVGPQQLRASISARELVERELRDLNVALERRVGERTAALERANADLRQEVLDRERAERLLRELNRTLEERVDERTEQVRELASELTLAEQRERRALAQVLHDDLQQSLYGVRLKLKVARKRVVASGQAGPDVPAGLDDADALVSSAIETTRRLTVDLSPVVLEGAGLDEALEWLVVYMEDRFGLRVGLTVDGPLTVPREDMRVLLFQAVREVLFNVARYADADRAEVALAERDGELVITVDDAGRGFDAAEVLGRPAGVAGGFGLRNARERLGLFGARLEVASKPGEGTRVRITVPVEAIK